MVRQLNAIFLLAVTFLASSDISGADRASSERAPRTAELNI